MKSFVHIIVSEEYSPQQKCIAMTQLRQLLFNSSSQKNDQDEAAKSGIVNALVSLTNMSQSDEVRSCAFDCIIEECFNNIQVSDETGKTELVDIVIETVKHSKTTLQLKQLSLTSVINLAGNSWNSHHKFIPLLPYLVHIIINEVDDSFRLRAVMLLNNLAYNPDMTKPIIEAGAVNPLTALMQQTETKLAFFIASIAVANLDPHNEILVRGAGEKIIYHITTAFSRVLQGKDYPAGSNLYGKSWKLAMTFSKLCENKANRVALRKAGILKLLNEALTIVPHDKDLCYYSLKVLWKMSEDD
eukprot:c14093_g1_i2.p1 GENE.c14093_g1_i2~~c14093_g1_i2.p1  ORF type:complete len:301 (+),score=85.56 c14093_g1_i2:17-919(+)